MTPMEVLTHVTRVRADRRLTKERLVVKKKRKVASEKSQSSVTKLLDGLSDAERATVLRRLGDAQGHSTTEDHGQG